MLSVVCAIPCLQAEFTFPPFENDQMLQGPVLYTLCCCRGCRRSGGPRIRGRCSARAMHGAQLRLGPRVTMCTPQATARDYLGRFA